MGCNMGSNRVRVGFHRAGIALAILPGLAAAGAVIWGAYEWGRPLVKPPVWEIEHKATGKLFEITYDANLPMMGKQMKEVFAPMRVPDEVAKAVDEGVVRVDRERQSGLETMGIGAGLFALAASVCAASWLLGWVLRGFIGEDAT